MADVTVTADQVGLVDPIKAYVKSYKCGEAITKGAIVAMNTDGTLMIADSTDGAVDYKFEQVQGVALQAGAAGAYIDVCQDGDVYGFSVSGLNAGAILWLSQTAGKLATTDVGATTYVGRVTALPTPTPTLVVRIQIIFAEAKAA